MQYWKSIDKILDIIMALTVCGLMLPQIILPIFINTTKYINNSDTIELSALEYIDGGSEKVYFGNYRSAVKIKNDNTYYKIYYYKKNRSDSISPNPFWSTDSKVYLPINPIEFKKHKGTFDDPISVFNYGFQPNQYEFDNRSYRYNIKSHIARVEILHISAYHKYLWLIFAITGGKLLIQMIFFQKNRSS